MPYARHGDVRIFYRVEGSGRPLVLLHGFGASSEALYFLGWVAALRESYRLIVMDMRGHGQSDKPHEPEAYRMEQLVGDVTAVLDSFGARQAHFLGYSSGGEIGWGMAKYAPERLTSLIVGGAEAEDPDPDHPSKWSEQTIRLLRSGREAFVAAAREAAEREIRVAQRPALLEAILPQRLQLIAKADPEALIAMLLWQQKEVLRIRDILPHLTIPCLLFVGEADGYFEGAKAASRLIPRARFVSLPGMAHFETAARADLVAPPLLRFLTEVDRGFPD
ncbi:MAG: alpha/beta hydrolase [Thermoplasmata archaeon]|jgi:pimeloyl-ACP methyl ester carboxylesterase